MKRFVISLLIGLAFLVSNILSLQYTMEDEGNEKANRIERLRETNSNYIDRLEELEKRNDGLELLLKKCQTERI